MWTKKSVGVACLTHLIMMALYFSDLMFIYVLFSASSYFLHPELFPSHCFNQPLYFLYVLFIRYFFGLLPSMLVFVKIVINCIKLSECFYNIVVWDFTSFCMGGDMVRDWERNWIVAIRGKLMLLFIYPLKITLYALLFHCTRIWLHNFWFAKDQHLIF